ncbi:transmembrane protein 272-like isoform X2 [Alosa pseudoharengus]
MDSDAVLGRIISYLSSTPVLVSLELLVFQISIAEIVIGALYLDSCPIQRYIPIYLVVTGVFTLSLVFLACRPRHDIDISQDVDRLADEVPNVCICCICSVWHFIISLFLLCWVIAGSVWIYSIYQPNYNPAEKNYCDKTAYLFASWITPLNFIVAGIGIVVCRKSIVSYAADLCLLWCCICLKLGHRR